MNTAGYTKTRVSFAPTEYVESFRALVAALLPSLAWRHHAIGVLQAYVSEGGTAEMRVHIWHPALARSGVESEGQIHDHRFDLRSTVLCGSLRHDEYHLTNAEDGAWRRWEVQNARSGSAAPTLVGSPCNAHIIEGAIPEFATYAFPLGAFHRSRAEGLAVTLVTKGKIRDAPAQLLCPSNVIPRHGFVDNNAVIDIVQYIKMAKAALR